MPIEEKEGARTLHPTKTPKVSVSVVTYNQQEYIEDCLASIVNQETNFSFEVVVGDDCSTDNTVKIISDYATKYPLIIKPIFRNKNIGPSANYFDVVNRCSGEYIAHIDGDDLMLPGKLRIQTEILDSMPDVSMVVHPVDQISGGTKAKETSDHANECQLYELSDLLRLGCFFAHSSKMYRSSAILTRGGEKEIVDYYLHLEHSVSGKIAYIDTVLGQYRTDGGGISKAREWRKRILDAYDDAFDRALELGVDQKIVNYGRIRHRQAIALSSLMRCDYAEFREFSKIPPNLRACASAKQIILSEISGFPRLTRLLQHTRQTLSR